MPENTSLIISTPGGATDNCYVTTLQAAAYFANTLRAATWEGWTVRDRELALIQGTQELEALGGEWQSAPLFYATNGRAWGDDEDELTGRGDFGRARFSGTPYYLAQCLHFPRAEDLIAGPLAIPKNVRDACCEQAFWLLEKQASPDLMPRADLQAQGVRTVSLDGVTETYGPRRVPAGIAPRAYALMRPYIITSVRVERA